MSFLFTSESVSEGHPDKICDAISDSVLDAILEKDPKARVACETFVTTGLVLVGGEITTKAYIEVPEVVRETVRRIGYTSADYKFDADSCSVLNAIHSQSPDIAMGVDTGGAGDQGLMFGYACDQTPELMPMPIMYAHKLVKKLADIRKRNNELMSYLRPDAKSQVTIEYDGKNKPKRVDTVVVSTQHDGDAKQKRIKEDVIENVVKKIIPAEFLDKKTKYFVNPTGKFEIGGPHGDSGLTGRKIIVDTYGGWAPHGGGAFSGKDPSKVDRSASYAARHIAKNIVAAKLATECLVQIAYAIGVAEPVSVYVKTYGTGVIPDKEISKIINKEIDLTPKGIISRLNLLRPIYRKTSAYGHFGRNEKEFSWEHLDLVPLFKKYA
ncbi:MAG: methionine adenosyltransferase [Ignavibacteria bacterium RIFOXYB2_FULL_35_12]|nr:MAG: methionine adenosyltransferase [Ignavibacteria bacterium GWA2_36_19]OGU55458.1 MAG: methionine adenosyltransferase [Ignavibacteria bacterium GWC2_35_8]OGU60804.1 MAG: methionine adenosyltransferase [Ignavibacteria bacterium GWF2_35_20]OGU80969.1 MAG: methionine adenosyltransferase [Ignavibacteria bacterium RBG_16_35_7]OGU81595.1 MAG: methionine adenosyltransferase [Ignavibacteria bacterium RIFOXYA2_FULL_35_9]OGU87469.1 MAG: methionine adenosyltransferase [Ignavibacteria bacterium RIFOX